MDPPSATVRDAGEFLDVDVDQLTGSIALIPHDWVVGGMRFEFGDGLLADRLAEQLSSASIRIGGLAVGLGILHATTFLVLPLVAFVDNCTRSGRSLPRWVLLLLILIATLVLHLVPIFIGIGAGGFD